ncbi:L-ribulose-5-phosphate 3-epimerase [Clostridium felsineum]|uniref:L-ribulose-5-phosphate 3-epimerase n=1 Tax=Clostridium felsineum TaxID=36839 RepID=UPI00098CB48A|nr:L-ribulose-5-phosphate 3-epimerase [Clostridium felsineum]URZ18095.1 L-ribulose-5-phosphate 3-epimerase UlaE [Clostridium felsineum DSM 794]
MEKYDLGLYEKAMPKDLSWREKLICAKEAGYDFVEISIDETDEKLARLDSSKEERIEILKTSYEVGIPISTMCLSGHRKYPLGSLDENVRNSGMEIMKKAIDFAMDLGIRIIQLAGYDVYYENSTEETRELFNKNLIKAVEYAAKRGIILAFETMETEFMNTVGKAMKYVKSVDSPYLGVYPDSGNLTNAAIAYNNSVLEDIKSGKGHIAAFHLKETVPGKFREIPFGTGHVDFEKIIETAWSLGVRKYVAEFWYVGSENWREEIKFANRFMSEKINKIIEERGDRSA